MANQENIKQLVNQLRVTATSIIEMAESFDMQAYEIKDACEDLAKENELLKKQNEELNKERQHYIDAYIEVSDNPIWKNRKKSLSSNVKCEISYCVHEKDGKCTINPNIDQDGICNDREDCQ